MSLYADYLRERTTDLIIENDYGFATYQYMDEGKTVYIIDIYVKPEKRKEGLASKLADEIVIIAKANGCTEVVGTVIPSAKGSTDSLKVLLAYGMRLKSSTNNFIVFSKPI